MAIFIELSIRMEIVRGGQVARYAVFVYGLTDNDYRPNPALEIGLHKWNLGDFGLFRLSEFQILIKSINALLTEKGIENYLLNYVGITSEKVGITLEKYNEEIPEIHLNRLFRLVLSPANSAIVGEAGYDQLGIVVWSSLNPVPFELTVNPDLQDYQAGIDVPEDIPLPVPPVVHEEQPQQPPNVLWGNMMGGKRRTRRHRSKKRHTRRRHH